ncbi:MAG: aminotransferase class I/II-fold pyridoxal phosphate-dependent enzyme [Clostridia bacterium]|nr:aminotransferase class I/II-fold pyridoxal phosphate-dependent enzyme [Clostridia bacterium]
MISSNYYKLSEQYLFSRIGRIISERHGAINLSIGDVSLPLPREVSEAGARAAMELGDKSTFRGYPPECGYDFLRKAVARYYNDRGVTVDQSEVFISDGIKSDMAMFFHVFNRGKVLLPTPCYPAYIDVCAIFGFEVSFYEDAPSEEKADIIVICSPDNPTGRAKSKAELEAWVRYAKRTGAIILYDAAYEAFVQSGAPRSIYEIEGARECAVELCSFSKTAGFTGLRCGYTVVPSECGLGKVWARLKSSLSNGVSYVTQRMAECALTSALDKIRGNVKQYLDNAALFRSALSGADFVGGEDSPYIWLRVGDGKAEFYRFLDEYNLGVTPGYGFGRNGDGYVRINSFCSKENAIVAAQRLRDWVRGRG